MPGNRKILIVEDAKDIQMLLSGLLRAEGYEVDCAANGREALELLRAADPLPGVILLDLMMPDMDGYEFRREQEKDARIATIPIVAMTADGDVQVKALRIGAQAFLKKPFSNLELILSTVERLISR
jgi:CheY-like chemotaxis protein